MKILAVTSFGPDMLRSGTRLIESASRRLEADLLVCCENVPPGCIPPHPRRQLFDLLDSETLRNWLTANRDIIPKHLGGLTDGCGCAAESAFQGHEAGCHWFWFNRNASRWFRKLAALEIAFERTGYDAVLWLDSDCRVRRRVSAELMSTWFGEASGFYLKSPFREAVESGILGLRMDADGFQFLGITLERFRSGEFRKYLRWDDGFQFAMTLRENPDICVRDLATHVTGGTFVLPNSPLAGYFSHDKGRHRRSGVMG